MKVNSWFASLASSPKLSDAHEMNSDELKATMKESPRRYTNPFLSDEENEKLNLWNNQEHERSNQEDNFTTNLKDERFSPCNAPSEPIQKAKELYIDKKVTECQLPDLINGFQVVKDICVDDGLSHDEKIDVNKKHHELSCNPVTDAVTITDTDTVNGDKYDDMIEDEQLISLPLEDCCKNTDVESCVKEKSEGEEVERSNQTVDASNESKMEENMDLGLDNVKPVDTDGSKDPKCIHELLPDTESAPNQLQRGSGGESSFSMAGPVSGRMTSCGSISHRSDGSNTSVRSFAFPILQTEWNSSPVRMVKVEQRRSGKHWGWRPALRCCGF